MARAPGQISDSRTTSFSLNCSGDCWLQLDVVGLTQVLVSCLYSDLGFSICQLGELNIQLFSLGLSVSL